MKKSVFLLIVLFTCFCSCNKSYESTLPVVIQQTSTVEDDAFQDLRQQITLLNDEYGFCKNEVNTRGLWGFFKLIFSVTLADVIGGFVGSANPTGIVGGIVAGVATSIYVGCNQDNTHFFARNVTRSGNFQSVLEDLTFVSGPLAGKLDSMGYYHNAVILQMYENDPTIMDSTTYNRPDLIDSISVHHDIIGVPSSIMNNYVTNNWPIEAILLKQYLDNCKLLDDYSVFPNDKFWYDHSDILELLVEYVENISDLDLTTSTVYNYTDHYLDIVDASNISESNKSLLKTGVLIGHASSKLWKSQILL